MISFEYCISIERNYRLKYDMHTREPTWPHSSVIKAEHIDQNTVKYDMPWFIHVLVEFIYFFLVRLRCQTSIFSGTISLFQWRERTFTGFRYNFPSVKKSNYSRTSSCFFRLKIIYHHGKTGWNLNGSQRNVWQTCKSWNAVIQLKLKLTIVFVNKMMLSLLLMIVTW